MNARNQGREDRRSKRRGTAPGLEGLEVRELMAYSPLGYSLPDLTVQGKAGVVAGWGGTLGVTVDVYNLGASTLIEPLNLEQGAESTADSQPTVVNVYAVPQNRPRSTPLLIGSIDVPAVTQNDFVRLNGTFTLPQRPARFPGSGGRLSILFDVNPTRAFLENDFTNNTSRAATPTQIQAALPNLETVALDVPPVMNPGDTIQPNIRLGNFGTADTAPQGPVTVQLVASLDQNFGPGDSIIATYVIDNIPALSEAPSDILVLGNENLTPGVNITTLQGNPVTLPASPGSYFVGVIIDPDNTIKELDEVGRGPSSRLQQVRRVGPNTSGLPPAGVITPFDPTLVPVFPFPGALSSGVGTTLELTDGTATAIGTSSRRSIGTLQTRTLQQILRRSTGSLPTAPVTGNPRATSGFTTNQISVGEQSGSFLYNNNKNRPQANVGPKGQFKLTAFNKD